MRQAEIVKDLIETQRRLRGAFASEADPRVRGEIAETLDLLEPCIDREVDKLIGELLSKRAA